MRAPSKAGPAAVEAQSSRSRLPTTISPLVPRSTSAVSVGSSCIRVANTPVSKSLPTKPPKPGRKRTLVSGAMAGKPDAPGGTRHPSSFAVKTCTSFVAGSNGCAESGVMSKPQNKWCITVLPTSTTSHSPPGVAGWR
jgi:hypothetical protein